VQSGLVVRLSSGKSIPLLAFSPGVFPPLHSHRKDTCEHASGNLRLLVNMANDLLAAASHQERDQIDEKLYFEVFALDPKPLAKSS
jgi:hypothetical protein